MALNVPKYNDPVTDTPFSTHSLQMEENTKNKATKFTDEENAMMTITGSRNASWWGTLYHNVTAIDRSRGAWPPHAMT
eukprot:jgi/Botrbrau1/15785/Bobra.4_1s0137.1